MEDIVRLNEIDQDVLLALLNKDKLGIRELEEEIKKVSKQRSPNAITKSVDKLLKMGLVKEEKEEKPPRGKRLIYLTDKGKEVAQHLKSIYELIGKSG
ncbi:MULTISPECIES: winged helix DNA-binding protein [Sulfolobaceae]|uniref:Uncharacterized protein n=4 Tax=Sulfolobaceae TaxID=118883 RepID=A4YD12_METS5|nr:MULTISPECIES: winged helix DNA-binding protein [Sulfolobaceae]ABP94314.1 hypothetical protein Msed_0137 [Metallosphaera sedula DSM 5348]AIM26301.1 hypothetical protein HA72_0137 [Metallosphaera sedula]AKV73313.1 hypothetical protein MsedA_0142 [Metallosphaera sedula]AKV75557.1 hypothetical protein MsedB_0142 [Metallosphaera sedula]AKV77803.1 hypothetical protein MsedC_0141 [Metallosphaera sedula]